MSSIAESSLPSRQFCAISVLKNTRKTRCFHVDMSSVEKEKLFGYEIPMPRSDLFIALATVICFLPVTVIIYQSVMLVNKFLIPKRKQS